MPTDNPQTRRWFQFRLRTLLVLVTLVSIGLGWLVHERKKVRERREWLASIKQDSAHIAYGPGFPPQPRWLRTLLGKTTISEVMWLNPGNSNTTDAELIHLEGMKNLEFLSLSFTQVTDVGLAHLTGLKSLGYLNLDHTQITDAGLIHLAGLKTLNYLSLRNTQVSDAGLIHLAGLTNLESLNLENTQVTDAGLVHLARLTKLGHLYVDKTRVTDAGRQKLRQLLPNTETVPYPLPD